MTSKATKNNIIVQTYEVAELKVRKARLQKELQETHDELVKAQAKLSRMQKKEKQPAIKLVNFEYNDNAYNVRRVGNKFEVYFDSHDGNTREFRQFKHLQDVASFISDDCYRPEWFEDIWADLIDTFIID